MHTHERVFFGYSMYEVDGVFFDDKETNPRKQIVEERTQVIRLMFKPDLSEFENMDYKRLATLVKTFLRAPLSHFDSYLEYFEKSETFGNETLNDHDKNLLEYLARWVQRVIIFLIGYVVYEICNEISSLVRNKKIPKYEDEIWVTSFWNLLVYNINFDKKMLKDENIHNAKEI